MRLCGQERSKGLKQWVQQGEQTWRDAASDNHLDKRRDFFQSWKLPVVARYTCPVCAVEEHVDFIAKNISVKDGHCGNIAGNRQNGASVEAAGFTTQKLVGVGISKAIGKKAAGPDMVIESAQKTQKA
ncbi:hypothetical protein ACRRTK_005426 [Alexandromys fortis]